MKKNWDLALGALLIASAIIVSRYQLLTGFFVGFLYGAGLSLLIRSFFQKNKSKTNL